MRKQYNNSYKPKPRKVSGIESQQDYNDRVVKYALKMIPHTKLSLSECIRLAAKKLGKYKDIAAPVKHIPNQ